MGGSHAQRDPFYQILVDALRRAGQRGRLAIVFAEMRAFRLEHLEERSSYANALAERG